MALERKQFGQIKRQGNSFFVDNKSGDKVQFRKVKIDNQDDFFIQKKTCAIEQSFGVPKVFLDMDEIKVTLDSILSVCEDLKAQTEQMAKDRGATCEFAEVVSNFMNILGKNALTSELLRLDSSLQVSVFEDNGAYKFYVEVNGKKIDVNTSRFFYNLLLLDGTSIEKLLIPEATVLVRLRPAVEDYFKDAIDECCKTLKELISDGASDKKAVISRLDERISTTEKEDNDCEKKLRDFYKKQKLYENGSTEYKELSTVINNENKKREHIKRTYKTLSALKREIEDKYEKDSVIVVGVLKSSILIELALGEKWEFDVPGFITKDDVKYITSSDVYKIKGSLNYKKLTNESYYVRAADLRPFKDIMDIF